MRFDAALAARAAWLLPYIAGVASTVAGSWVASKIHVYQENRKLHQEDLKKKILSPILSAVENSYPSLVRHSSPVVSVAWGKRSTLKDAKVTETPEIHGPLLKVEDPGPTIERDLDEALLVDATKTHHRELIASWERFREHWTNHSRKFEAWVCKIASQILEQSGLGAHLQPFGEPYVMHLDLAVFVYHRIFDIPTEALSKEQQWERWWLKGAGGKTLAAASERNLDELLTVLENLRKSEREAAQELRKEAEGLDADLNSLHRHLSFAMAEKRFRRTCTLVPFF